MKKSVSIIAAILAVACGSENKYEKTVQESKEQTELIEDSLRRDSIRHAAHMQNVETLVSSGYSFKDADSIVTGIENKNNK